MTHHHPHEAISPEGMSDAKFSNSDHCDVCSKDVSYAAYVIGACILVGAILISASVFYNFKTVLKYMDNGGSLQRPAAAAPQQPSAPTAPQQPSGPVTVAERKDAPVIGNPSAKVTIYEFSDFQCPYCQRFFKDTYPQIKSKYIDTGKVKLVYRHYPLSFHVNAQKAAEAGECASRQGKFPAYHDVMFTKGQADGTGLAVTDLKQYAKDLGLNTSRFNQCLDNGEAVAAVKQDFDNGAAVGVSGTPSFVLDSKLIVGAMPYATFEQAIEAALKK